LKVTIRLRGTTWLLFTDRLSGPWCCFYSANRRSSTTPAQGSTRTCTGVLPPVENILAVDDDVLNSFIVLRRLLIRGPIDGALRVEQGQVGIAPRPEQISVETTKLGRVG
jgi:hypothetical protein